MSTIDQALWEWGPHDSPLPSVDSQKPGENSFFLKGWDPHGNPA